ncbi:MAG: hypothetical protein FWD19_05120 [Defluviitaleaceae bacterium]|nr:hypothetical protein [Defluviitaleaceae bacterium]
MFYFRNYFFECLSQFGNGDTAHAHGNGNEYAYFYEYTTEAQYDWNILNVTLTSRSVWEIAEENLSADQFEHFLLLMETQGNRPDLLGLL